MLEKMKAKRGTWYANRQYHYQQKTMGQGIAQAYLHCCRSIGFSPTYCRKLKEDELFVRVIVLLSMLCIPFKERIAQKYSQQKPKTDAERIFQRRLIG